MVARALASPVGLTVPVVGIGTLLYKFNQIRLAIDPLGVRDDVVEIGTGLATTGQYLAANPGDAPAVLFDTRTMHDNPARWWGGLAPDIALTAVAGAGFATRALSGMRTGARVAEELTDAARAGSRWDDVAARAQWVDDLRNGPDHRALTSQADWAQYQRRVAGDDEYILRGGGETMRADGVALDPDTAVALEAKFAGNPLASPYTGTSSQFGMDRVLSKFDDEMRRYGAVMADSGNPVTRLRIVASDPAAAHFLEARARALLGDRFDVVGEYRP